MMTYAFYLLCIAVLTFADQFSKKMIIERMRIGQKIEIIRNFFSIAYVRNYGAGFSILQNATVFLSAISILAVCAFLYLLFKENKKDILARISYILIISGAIGNLIDRLRWTYVVDFLDFLIFGYDFPVFNIADCFITVGCFLLLGQALWESKNA